MRMKNKSFKVGERVYHANNPDSLGTVAGPVYQSDKDGGDRQLVLWDLSGLYTAHDPIFLFKEGTPYDQVPDMIQSGYVCFVKNTGNWIIYREQEDDANN